MRIESAQNRLSLVADIGQECAISRTALAQMKTMLALRGYMPIKCCVGDGALRRLPTHQTRLAGHIQPREQSALRAECFATDRAFARSCVEAD